MSTLKETLEYVFNLESSEKYNDAYLKYKQILYSEPLNFQIWKYYFFFLWSMIEDVHGNFTIIKNRDLNIELSKELKFGLEKFGSIAEFNFLTGYTISIFPYEFGEHEENEKFAKKLLKRAVELDPGNPLYKMVYLANENKLDNDYEEARLLTKAKILNGYSKNGLLNEYFRDVFIRK